MCNGIVAPVDLLTNVAVIRATFGKWKLNHILSLCSSTETLALIQIPLQSFKTETQMFDINIRLLGALRF